MKTKQTVMFIIILLAALVLSACDGLPMPPGQEATASTPTPEVENTSQTATPRPITPAPTATPVAEGCLAGVEDDWSQTEPDFQDTVTQVECDGEGRWNLDMPELRFAPDRDTVANALDLIGLDGWHRILETADGEYPSWNFLTRITANRPVEAGEITWETPILLTIEPNEDLFIRIEVQLDEETVQNWERDGHSADPYENSLVGGEMLSWFLGAEHAIVSVDMSDSNFLLINEVCVDCTVPTSVEQNLPLLETDEWGAPDSDREVPHHVAVIQDMPRDGSAGVISWDIFIPAGTRVVLWQGTTNPEKN